MKLAVSSYSFSQAMRDGRMNIMDVIPKAKEMGYEGVEIVRGNQTDAEMRALAGYLKVQSAELSMPIVAYMVGADFLKNGLAREVKRLKAEAEIAALMGASRMRHDSTQGFDPEGSLVAVDDAIPVLADGYRQVTEFAAGLGVRTMIENHGYYMQDSERVKRLVEAVGHPNFGWLTDMGNFLCADENPISAMRVAAPMAVHAHAKDFHVKEPGQYTPKQGWFKTRGGSKLRGAIIGHGAVNVTECLRLLKQAGYDGWLSVEFEGIEDCLFALQSDIENLREMIESI
jgi:sugar phosphate isomerase/epimerase